jgi:preprotein translocase subunit SecG
MEVFKIVLTVFEVIASVALVVVVLLQSGKEAGLSGALSGNSDSYLSKSGKGGLDKMLARATKWVALAWLVLTLTLSLIP